jgi:hypothetical protein
MWSARSRCPIVDTWWQTETGGILITPLPGAPAQAGLGHAPVLRRAAGLVDDEGRRARRATTEGNLCIIDSWPGQMRTVYGDHERFMQTYFSTYKGKYFTGDGCRRDEDGYYWITGRVDDVINVSGHRMGTAEVESALVAARQGRRGRRRRLPARDQGPGHLCLRHADGRRGAVRRAAQGLVKELGAQRDRPDRHRRTLIQWCAGPAQDPLGQDHAPHPAQDRRRRVHGSGRRDHPGRSGRGGEAGGGAQGVERVDSPSRRSPGARRVSEGFLVRRFCQEVRCWGGITGTFSEFPPLQSFSFPCSRVAFNRGGRASSQTSLSLLTSKARPSLVLGISPIP